MRWPGYVMVNGPVLCQLLYKKTVRALNLLLQNFIAENPSMDEICFLLQVTPVSQPGLLWSGWVGSGGMCVCATVCVRVWVCVCVCIFWDRGPLYMCGS